MSRPFLRLASAFALLLAVVLPADASAMFAPVSRASGAPYPAPNTDVEILGVSIVVETAIGIDNRTNFRVTAELLIHNLRPEARSLELAIVDSEVFTAQTEYTVDGVPAPNTEERIFLDPARPEHQYDHTRTSTLELSPNEVVTIRAVTYWPPNVDSLGVVSLSLPTIGLALFAASIDAGRISVEFPTRAVGLQSTIQDFTLYDEPENVASWFVSDWVPTVPFQVSYLTPWSALILVAEAERCPEPWKVIQDMTAGAVSDLAAYLATFDDETKRFCSNLPLVLHGFMFESNAVRDQLRDIPMSRYIPWAGTVDRLYVENSRFAQAELTDSEALYMRGLRLGSHLDDGGPASPELGAP